MSLLGAVYRKDDSNGNWMAVVVEENIESKDGRAAVRLLILFDERDPQTEGRAEVLLREYLTYCERVTP